MVAKGDNQRSEVPLVRLVPQTAKQVLMSPMYAVKKSYGSYPFHFFGSEAYFGYIPGGGPEGGGVPGLGPLLGSKPDSIISCINPAAPLALRLPMRLTRTEQVSMK